ncbi:MAG: hypothetical protein RQ826_01960 [Xanthomonadales bacterium]|nr:hypothetical protein [Xanthomonadales bacterium]
MRVLLPAILLISAAAIAFEILLMRVLSIVQWHHFAWMVISLALLGYGASGTAIALGKRWLTPRFESTFAAAALLFSITMVLCYMLGQRVPFNALEVVWEPRQMLYLGLMYLLFMLPFFFAAACVGLAFSCRSQWVARIYLFDLLGAGSGALAVIGLLFVLRPPAALVLLAALALVASIAAGWVSPRRRALGGLQIAWAVALALLASSDLLALRMSQFKGLSQTLQTVDASVIARRSSPLAQLVVVESGRIPFRHAPGLSFATRHLPPDQLAVFADGDSMSVINRWQGDQESIAYLGDVSSALPYELLPAPPARNRVLVLGAGAGSDVLQALYHGAASVDAVELNPQMLELVRETFADFTGPVYGNARVNVHLGEARGFVARSARRYDLVQLGLLDSFAASGSGVQALNENYLYTVEAIGEYLGHLRPGGLLAITRWLRIPPRDSLKLTATVIAALRQAGVEQPHQRLAVIRGWNTLTLLVKNGELDAGELEAIRQFARQRSFDTVYYPGMPAQEANRYNRLDRAWFHEGVTALLSPQAEAYMRQYKFNIEPPTDERPYFFNFFRWRVLPEVLSLRERGGAGLVEWGYLVPAATLLQAALAGALLILLPLALAPKKWPSGIGGRAGTYFFLLGLAFLFVEIVFIQKFILFLSHPLYAVAVVLAGFLVFAGLGSGASQRLAQRAGRRGRSPLPGVVAGIALLALAYALALPFVFERLIGLPDGAKILLSLLLIAPLAFLMGMPFPLGLARLSSRAPEFIPWAWGINGFASVISAALAILLAIEFGFTVVLLLALALYAAAAAILGD